MSFIRWLWRQLLLVIAWFRPARVPLPETTEVALPPRSPKIYTLVHLAEDPDSFDPETLYAIGERGHLWHVTMTCPCGCCATIALNALPDDSPRWTLREAPEGPTLTPSVRRTTGCRSHFVVRRGHVRWCGEPHLDSRNDTDT